MEDNRPRILVVDDEPDVCQSLASFISKRINCDIEIATDGRQALEKLKVEKFDVALLDINMPGLSGIDVIKEAVKFTPQTRILAISAYDSQEIAAKALEEGAIDYIHKPHSIEAIELKVKDILIKIGKYQDKKA